MGGAHGNRTSYYRRWPMGFYTYVFFLEGVPLYVGASKGGRANPYNHVALRRAGIPPTNILLVLYEQEDRVTAFEFEEQLIHEYGRKDLGTGSLVNRNDGGIRGLNQTPESHRRSAVFHKGKPLNKEHREKLTRAMLGNQNSLGCKRSPETLRRMSEAGKRRYAKENKDG